MISIRSTHSAGLTLLIGLIGAVLATILSFPAPGLTGPALLVTLAGLCGLPTHIPAWLRQTCFLIIGITMGAGVTPETIETAQRWPGSLLLLFVGLMLIMVLGTYGLKKLFGYDTRTAFLSSVPGHLSFILSLSSDTKTDQTALSIMQSCRVLFLTLVVPFLAGLLSDWSLPHHTSTLPTMPLPDLALVGFAALVIGFVFVKLKVPAAILLGGLFISALAHATDISHGNVPEWLSFPAFAVMGAIIGTRFSGVRWPELRPALAGAGYVTLISTGVSLALALVLAWFLRLPLTHILVAVAPGGLEAMAAMGVLLGINPAFVAAHHVSRLLFLSIALPLAMRLVDRKMNE